MTARSETAQQNRWQLMTLLAVASVAGGASMDGLKRGMSLIPGEAIEGSLRRSERQGLVTRRMVGRTERWFMNDDVSLNLKLPSLEAAA